LFKLSRPWLALALGGAIAAPVVWPLHARAQTPAPADAPRLPPAADPALQEQDRLRREQRLQQQRQLAPEQQQDAAASADAADAGPTFVLQRVRFSSSRHLQREQLAQITQPLLGKPVRWGDLQALVARVNQLYRDLGVFTAAATLPEQQIQDGTVIVQLVEGRLGQVKVQQNEQLPEGYVRGWMQGLKPAGDVDARRLEADLARFNRVNDAKLQAALQAGQGFGETDLLLTVQEPARTGGQVFVDNHGYRGTGRVEAGAVLRRHGLFAAGDRALGYVLAAEGSQALSLSYSAPVGFGGWRAGASLAMNRTKMIAGDFASIDVRGKGDSVGLDASYLVHSAERWWASVAGSVQRSTSGNDVRDVAVSRYEVTRVNLGVPVNVVGGTWHAVFNPVLVHARAHNKLLPAQSANATLLTGDASLVWRPGGGAWYGLGQLAWQYTNRRSLPGALAFTVGGAASARGYEPGQLSGDKGLSASLELHHDGWRPADTRLDLFAFVDAAQLHSINASVQRPLAAGLGVNWSGWKGLGVSVSAAQGLRDLLPEQRGWQAYARVSWAF